MNGFDEIISVQTRTDVSSSLIWAKTSGHQYLTICGMTIAYYIFEFRACTDNGSREIDPGEFKKFRQTTQHT